MVLDEISAYVNAIKNARLSTWTIHLLRTCTTNRSLSIKVAVLVSILHQYTSHKNPF